MLLSFLFDIPIFLPIMGAFLFWLDRREKIRFKTGWILSGLVATVTAGFCLYFEQPLLLAVLGGALLLALGLALKARRFLWTFVPFTLALFWIVSGGLYYDLWGAGGNHFMWYTWLDKIGVIGGNPVGAPTYENPSGFWHLFGLALFLSYPIVLLVCGKLLYRVTRKLKGFFFGHLPGQTGLWGLFTNK